ncbi:hypothetical protein NP233_g74 [Leucocoprinus birnbaumii]|uniref:DUF6532 domain-containing protein n=1 Tax=Leucocoprinus birnbaumii TaxID=56174 RepID=A0AAD5W4I3_9AGAR|nr:hypothetical protein NP233_g74 [Leucocoprinus birnbaumii]
MGWEFVRWGFVGLMEVWWDSLPSPPRKKAKFSRPAASDSPAGDEQNSFNPEYGGILDDEIQETVPPAGMKPSQVKISAHVVHNAPMVKVEALDPGLPSTRRTRGTGTPAPRKDRGYLVLELTSDQLRRFKQLVIPAFRSVIGCLEYPWDNTNPELLDELRFIWPRALPDVKRQLHAQGNEYGLAIQRATEYRARIAKDVKNAVRVHLIDTCGDSSPSSIQEYVDLLLEKDKARYLWKTTDLESLTGTFEGLFLAPYIVAGISSHLEMTAGLPDELTVSTYPQGALALATVAAERALKGWVNGRGTIGEDLSNRKNEEFSETLWGTATKTVMASIKKISAKK